MDTNIVVMIGRLTNDIEIRVLESGTSVGRFRLANNRRKKQGDQWVDETSYYDVVLWGKTAESLRQYLTKGRQVSVKGELRQNRWEQNGEKKSRVEIMAEDVQLLAAPQNQTATNTANPPVPPVPPTPQAPQGYNPYPQYGYQYPPQGQTYPQHPQYPPQGAMAQGSIPPVPSVPPTPQAPPAPPVPPVQSGQPNLPSDGMKGPESFVDDEEDIPF